MNKTSIYFLSLKYLTGRLTKILEEREKKHLNNDYSDLFQKIKINERIKQRNKLHFNT